MNGDTPLSSAELLTLLAEVVRDLASAHDEARALGPIWQRDATEGERATAALAEHLGGALARLRQALPGPAAEEDDSDPVWLDGLPAALRRLARETGGPGLRVELALRGYTPPPGGAAGRPERDRDEHLFRIAKAALSGVVRQARATEATLLLSQERGRLELKLVDDGAPEPGARSRGRGGPELAEIRDHVEALGGRLRITSRPGGGTILAVTLYEEPKAG